MKTIVTTVLMTLASSIAFGQAQTINLKAGSSVVLGGQLVTCEQQIDLEKPACSIKQDGGYYRLYAGTAIVESFYNFNAALEGAKKVKDAGLCR